MLSSSDNHHRGTAADSEGSERAATGTGEPLQVAEMPHLTVPIDDLSPYGAVQAFYTIFHDILICTQTKPKPVWYRFSGHSWHRDGDDTFVRGHIAEITSGMVQQAERFLAASHTRGRAQQQQTPLKATDSREFIRAATKRSFIRDCTQIAAELFFDGDHKEGENPCDRLAANVADVIALRNGVCDLRTDRFHSPGLPQHYATTLLPINYPACP
jgi:hypothetical protein